MINTTWTPASFSHAKEHGTVTFHGDYQQPYGFLTFQDGPLVDHGENGVTNEAVITALIERLTALNLAPFECAENHQAINHLVQALAWLDRRTAVRTERGVEGTEVP